MLQGTEQLLAAAIIDEVCADSLAREAVRAHWEAIARVVIAHLTTHAQVQGVTATGSPVQGKLL